MFIEKLNKKIDGSVYVIEELQSTVGGKYEGYLSHDNSNLRTLKVYTGPKLTGDRVIKVYCSTPKDTPWKTFIRVYSNADKIYITYETPGDQVEAGDINNLQEEIIKHNNVNKIIGVAPAKSDYICDGVRDDAQFQQAIDDLGSVGGKIIVLPGTYHFSKCVNMCSNLVIELFRGAKVIMDAQIIANITSDLLIGSNTVTLSSEEINKFQIGMEVGFVPDQTNGYRSGNFVTRITNIIENTITLKDNSTKNYLASASRIASLNSCFTAIDSSNQSFHDIEIIGGELDGNKSNNPIWIADITHNGVITGGVTRLKMQNIVVHDWNFQGIHFTGSIAYNPVIEGRNSLGSTMENCIAYNCFASGLCVDSMSEHVEVLNCIGHDNGNSGLQLVVASYVNVTGGQYFNNGFCGVRLCHDEIVSYQNKISGVLVRNNGRGIAVKNSVGTIISNCETQDNNEAGIYLEESCIQTVMANCVMRDEGVGVLELASGADRNSIIAPSFINCTTNTSLSDAALVETTDGMFQTNKYAAFRRVKFDAPNNHMQFWENGVQKWHLESVGGVFSFVESGVLERLILNGNSANLQANLKMRKFGCNGKEAQGSVMINNMLSENTGDATLNATNALVNQLRAALIANGICS